MRNPNADRFSFTKANLGYDPRYDIAEADISESGYFDEYNENYIRDYSPTRPVNVQSRTSGSYNSSSLNHHVPRSLNNNPEPINQQWSNSDHASRQSHRIHESPDR